MWQKIIVGLLALTVVGAVGVGVYDASRSEENTEALEVLATPPADDTARDEEITPTPEENATPISTATPNTVQATPPTVSAPDTAQESANAAAMVGDPWQGTGVILAFDDVGMTVQLIDGTEIYVELGPPFAWQEADVTLAVGDTVTVQGFFNGEQYHAAIVTKNNGETLRLRTEEGMPLWAGNESAGNGMGTEAGVPADAWITLQGTVTSFQGATLEMLTTAGETLALNLGQAGFVESQGITFADGDAIAVLGFWQGDVFRAGEITKLETGERLMLLDPNGRPLWGGPGRGGAHGTGSSQGNGNGYQGGRNPNFTAGNAH